MKKTLALAAALGLSLAMFTACGDKGDSSAAVFDATQDISVVSREDGSGTRGAFIELFGIEVKGEDGTKTDTTTEEAIIASKTDVMLTNIASNEYAIGYVSLGSLSDAVKALAIDGTAATVENVKNGSYNIARPFNIATKGEVEGLAKDFIAYILSAEGQAVVAGSYIAVDENAPAFQSAMPTGKIVVSGSSSVSPIMEKLIEAYLVINPDAVIELQTSDSSTGMADTISGVCDIGMASRELKDSEKETLTSTVIAIDGIAVITNPANPLEGLSKDQVKAIFTGNALTWDEVYGG